MGQNRYWEYLAEDDTFSLNWSNLLLLPYGRYAGFDATLGASLNLVLDGSQTGKTKVTEDLNVTVPFSVWKTKQGIVVEEDGSISLPITAGDSTHDRIDLVVGTHQYLNTAGGATAVYSIIEGTPAATPVAPNLSLPEQQVILGTLRVPANATDLTGATYTPANVPDLGNQGKTMYTDRIQDVRALKRFQRVEGELGSATLDIANNRIILNEEANYYILDTVTGTYNNTWVQVDEIVASFSQGAYPVRIITQYALMITNTGNISYPNSEIWVRENESLDVLGLRGTTFASEWALIRGGDISSNREEKWLKTQIWANAKAASYVLATESVDLAEGTNFNTLTATAEIHIKHIKSLQTRVGINSTPAQESGGVIYIQLDIDAVIHHDSSSAPAGYKPIWVSNKADLNLSCSPTNPTLLVLLETPDNFRLIAAWNETYNLERLAANFTIEGLDNVTASSQALNDVLVYKGVFAGWENEPFEDAVNPYIPAGTVMYWAGSSASNLPANYLPLQGQFLNKNTYPKLYLAIGDFYGSTATDFKIPDARDKFIVGAGNGYAPADTGGSSQVVLTVANIPAHHHESGFDGATLAIGNSGVHSHQIRGENAGTGGSTNTVLMGQGNGTSVTQNTELDSHEHLQNAVNGKVGDGTSNGLNSAPVENRPPYLALIPIIKCR